MNSYPKVDIRFLEARDLTSVVEAHLEQLVSSYVVINTKTNEVIVRDGSDADMKFRNSTAGECVPTGTQTVAGMLYRTYRVGPNMLK